MAQGAPIEGEAGIGFVLRRGFFLPPLRFTADEVDALILGLRLVARRGDEALEAAAGNALAKIEAMLPPDIAGAAESGPLLAGPGTPTPHLAMLRRAIAEAGCIQCQGDRIRHRRIIADWNQWPIAASVEDLVRAAWTFGRHYGASATHCFNKNVGEALPPGAKNQKLSS